MKSSMYGALSLGVALLAACSGDPTADQRNGPDQLIITPGFLVINVNGSELVTTQLVDDQGNALATTFNATANNGAVVAVAESIGYRPGLGANRLTSVFRVSALSIDSSSVTFTAGGKSTTVPVLVSPLNVPAIFGPVAPNVNDLVTVTATGFKFLPSTTILFGGVTQLIESIAADSSSITFRATKAGAGTFSFSGIAVGYLPSIGLNLDADAPTTVGPAITKLAGTDAIATAPVVLVPADGVTIPFEVTDAGPFNNSADCNNGAGGASCLIYKFTLAADQSFDVASSWDNNSDLGIYFVDVSNSDVYPGFGCDAHGTGAAGANFETCTVDLPAGTYYMQVVTFAAFYPAPNNVDPSIITVTLTDHP